RTFSSAPSIHIRIADEGEVFAVGRPGWNVHSPLPSINVGNDFGCATFNRHQANANLFVVRMVGWTHVFGKAYESNPLTVGRNMLKPVVELVIGDLLLV